jgi:hypothetical protein
MPTGRLRRAPKSPIGVKFGESRPKFREHQAKFGEQFGELSPVGPAPLGLAVGSRIIRRGKGCARRYAPLA